MSNIKNKLFWDKKKYAQNIIDLINKTSDQFNQVFVKFGVRKPDWILSLLCFILLRL